MNITYAQVKSIVAPAGKTAIVQGFADYFNKYAETYGITTFLRVCHFIAQTAEESDSYNTLHEYASGAEYQGRMGNTSPGDGIKYKGEGYIELTGKYNHEQAGMRLGLDLVNHPELCLQPENGMLVSLDYWKQHNLNLYADRDDIVTITHLVNGGENGLATRKLFLAKAKAALKGVNFAAVAPPPTAPKPVAAPASAPVIVAAPPPPDVPAAAPPAVLQPTPPPPDIPSPPPRQPDLAAQPPVPLTANQKAATASGAAVVAAVTGASTSGHVWVWIGLAVVAIAVIVAVLIIKKKV